jgi:hypothetical protein
LCAVGDRRRAGEGKGRGEPDLEEEREGEEEGARYRSLANNPTANIFSDFKHNLKTSYRSLAKKNMSHILLLCFIFRSFFFRATTTAWHCAVASTKICNLHYWVHGC